MAGTLGMRLGRCAACGVAIVRGETTDGEPLTVDAHEQIAGPNRYVFTGGSFAPIGEKATKYAYVDHAFTCSRT